MQLNYRNKKKKDIYGVYSLLNIKNILLLSYEKKYNRSLSVYTVYLQFYYTLQIHLTKRERNKKRTLWLPVTSTCYYYSNDHNDIIVNFIYE